MDCRTVADRVAPYLDGELGPSESNQLEEHLDHCGLCKGFAERVAAQPFPPRGPLVDALPASLWDAMDAKLADELDRELRRRDRAGVPRPPFWRRRLRLRGLHVIGYAALLFLSLGWALNAHQEAETAQARVEALQQQLERESRLAADPVVVPAEGYRMVTYTPHRGTF